MLDANFTEDLSNIMKPPTAIDVVEFYLLDKADVIDAQPILVREI